jgi:hypothetical protein
VEEERKKSASVVGSYYCNIANTAILQYKQKLIHLSSPPAIVEEIGWDMYRLYHVQQFRFNH